MKNSYIMKIYLENFDKYMDIIYAIELCRPYFHLEYGKLLVDDLIRIAMDFSIICDGMVMRNEELLTGTACANSMAERISKFGDMMLAIPWSQEIKDFNNISTSDFTDYISSKLMDVSVENCWSNLNATNRAIDWNESQRQFSKSVACVDGTSGARNGACVTWNSGEVDTVSYHINDSMAFMVRVHPGNVEVLQIQRPPVVEKTTTSDLSWSAILAGVVGGVIASSVLKKKVAKTTVVEKETSVCANKYGK